MTRLITAAALCCIALPAFAANECGHASIDWLIKSMCDFGKAIVPGGDTVMCVVR
jgi:hypothetical protein